MENDSFIYPRKFLWLKYWCGQQLQQIRSNPINTDIEGAIQSVRLMGVSGRIKRVMLFK